MEKSSASEAPLYLQIAQLIEKQIRDGVLRVGDRIPSIRSLSREQRISISTALQAYMWLENRGYVEARNKSGFYALASRFRIWFRSRNSAFPSPSRRR